MPRSSGPRLPATAAFLGDPCSPSASCSCRTLTRCGAKPISSRRSRSTSNDQSSRSGTDPARPPLDDLNTRCHHELVMTRETVHALVDRYPDEDLPALAELLSYRRSANGARRVTFCTSMMARRFDSPRHRISIPFRRSPRIGTVLVSRSGLFLPRVTLPGD
jgi:hypothetical protein